VGGEDELEGPRERCAIEDRVGRFRRQKMQDGLGDTHYRRQYLSRRARGVAKQRQREASSELCTRLGSVRTIFRCGAAATSGSRSLDIPLTFPFTVPYISLIFYDFIAFSGSAQNAYRSFVFTHRAQRLATLPLAVQLEDRTASIFERSFFVL
jgi:hypothetical protein